MSVGGSIGQTFLHENLGVGGAPIDGRRTGGVQDTGMPSIGAPAEGLQAIDNLVTDYHTSWANLNSFAKHAKKKYGIDVTAPDFSDPLQADMHKTFMKSYAQVKAAGNALQRGRENEQFVAQQAAARPDFFQTPQDSTRPATLEGVGNLGVRGDVNAARQSINRSFTNYNAYRSALQEKEALQSQYEQALETSTDPTEKAEIESQLRAIQTFTPNYNPPIIRPTEGDKRRADVGKRMGEVVTMYQALVNNDSEQLKRIAASPKVDRAEFSWQDGEKVARITFKDKNQTPVNVSLDNPEGLQTLGNIVAEGLREYEDIIPSELDPKQIDMKSRRYADQENQAIEMRVNDITERLAENPYWTRGSESYKIMNEIAGSIDPTNPLSVYDPVDKKSSDVIGLEVTNPTFGTPKVVVKFSGQNDIKRELNDPYVKAIISDAVRNNPEKFGVSFEGFEEQQQGLDEALSQDSAAEFTPVIMELNGVRKIVRDQSTVDQAIKAGAKTVE